MRHYQQHRRGKVPCTVEGCRKPASAGGLCHIHYYRWRHNGSPEVVLRRPKIAQPVHVQSLIPAADKTVLDALAARGHTTLSGLIAQALREFVERAEYLAV